MTEVGSRLRHGQTPTSGRGTRQPPGGVAGARFKEMQYWYYFWTFNFIVAGSAFSVIAVIVCIRGIKDLRKMFSNLRHHVPEESSPHQ